MPPLSWRAAAACVLCAALLVAVGRPWLRELERVQGGSASVRLELGWVGSEVEAGREGGGVGGMGAMPWMIL